MTRATESIDRMFEAWNETDVGEIRRRLELALAPTVHFVDPTIDLVGLDDFEANIHHVHGQIPGARYARTSAVDEHHGFHRYHWAIHHAGEEILTGFDVVHTDSAHRIEQVIGFFGALEPGVVSNGG